MYSKVAIIFAAMAIAASAAPNAPAKLKASEVTVPQAQAMCGNGNTVSCCNNSADAKNGDKGLLGNVGLNNLLGGTCQQINIPILLSLIPIQDVCGDNIAACCNGDKEYNGAVNLSLDCTPLNLL